MHLSETDDLLFAATDLSNFLACPQVTRLDRQAAFGGPKPLTFDDPHVEVLRQRGHQHEQDFLESLSTAKDLEVVEIPDSGPDLPAAERWTKAAADTLDAMRSGADVIYQATLFDGAWVGKPDFLRRLPTTSSNLGDWSYEVIDAKLAREAKAGAILQITLYSDLLGKAQGLTPEHMHLALGGPEPTTESFRVADYAAYYRSVRRWFDELIENDADPIRCPEPVPHCDVCAWQMRCKAEWREDDHLSLVAGISRRQRQELVDREIATVAGLARMPLPPDPPFDGSSATSVEKVREQARIQVEGREAGEHLHELLLPVEPGQGLARLPEPSPGDLFFDIESDQFVLPHGIEYLFGFVDVDGTFEGWWALDAAEEKAIFERFMDMVMERLEEHPDLHVYHFGAYEPSALKRLMGRHGTREDEVDRLLRGGRFVDLHRVVRQGLRASVESYSIKALEPLYGFERDAELRSASMARANLEVWLELGRPGEDVSELRDEVERYNRDDCVSTLRLRDWLEERREEAAELPGDPVPRPEPESGDPGEELAEAQERVAEVMAELTHDVPMDEEERSADQHARWLMAQLLQWHRRERKSAYWEYFHWRGLSDEELLEDSSTLGGLTYVGIVDEVKRSYVHRYRFPPQEYGIRVGTGVKDPHAERAPEPATRVGEVWALDDAHGTIDLKRSKNSDAAHPTALIPYNIIPDTVLRESLLRLGEAVARDGLGADVLHSAAADILLRRPPRVGQSPGANLAEDDEEILDAAVRLAHRLSGTVLPIQGPPGSGKTYTGAQMILSLLEAGKRVGITATSHKVIGNLLEMTCEAARKKGFPIKGIQRAEEDQRCAAGEIETASNQEVRDALESGEVRLAAGTAWLWSREEMAGSVDVLVVDEAGQFSLANTLAVCQAADSVVLVGDPRQLEQPQQGVHPPGADVSALDHLLAAETTISSDRGLFLTHTRRLHPEICAFTSELFYRGRLRSRPELERQSVHGPDPFDGSGLRFVPVRHAGNQNESPEEAEVVSGLVRQLLSAEATWTNQHGAEKTLGLEDVLIVAPYNAQVAMLSDALPDGARVGTVDKFQGQEAPIVIYSMTTSSADEAPRGMSFLYSSNRVNVATSRARCVALVVGSPELFAPKCRSPQQMKLANTFCRFREMAEVFEVVGES